MNCTVLHLIILPDRPLPCGAGVRYSAPYLNEREVVEIGSDGSTFFFKYLNPLILLIPKSLQPDRACKLILSNLTEFVVSKI